MSATGQRLYSTFRVPEEITRVTKDSISNLLKTSKVHGEEKVLLTGEQRLHFGSKIEETER